MNTNYESVNMGNGPKKQNYCRKIIVTSQYLKKVLKNKSFDIILLGDQNTMFSCNHALKELKMTKYYYKFRNNLLS